MKSIVQTRRGRWIFPLLVFFAFCLPSPVSAANEALDLQIADAEEGRTQVAVLLLQKPLYSLSWNGGTQITLALHETSMADSFRQAIAKQGKWIKLEEATPAVLRLTIDLKGSPKEVECSWSSKENILLVHMDRDREPGKKGSGRKMSNSLRRLRFGARDGFTRMVADMSENPAWGVTSSGDQSLLFTLRATSSEVRRSKFGPMKGLRGVTLSSKGEDLEIKAEPETPLGRVKIFWLKQGSRWVVDYFDHAPQRADAPMRFDQKAGLGKGGPDPALLEIRDGAIADQENAVKDGEGPVVGSGMSAAPPSGQGAKVRLKIAKPAPAELPDEQWRKPSSFRTDPEIPSDPEVGLPEASQRVFNLRPAEAYLYGRIRETLKWKDYERAAVLIHEFLGGFPESILTEELAFLAGDCLFAVMERGDQSLYPKVVDTYQETISRFPRSSHVPRALIRTASAHELAGNDREAMGSLAVAINLHTTGDHVPAALVARGRIYLRLNQPQRAVEDFKTVISRYPACSVVGEARYGMAGYLHGIGLYDEAEIKLKEISDSAPRFYQDHPEYLFLRARNSFYRKDYVLAREQYFRALNLGRQPESSDLLIAHIGDTYFHQSREMDAEKLYRLAGDYFPGSEGAGIAKLRIADQSSGVTAYEEVYRNHLNQPIGDLALLEMAGKFYKRGEQGLAMETLRRLLGRPGQTDVQREAVQLFFRCAEKEIRGYHDGGRHEKVTEFFLTADPALSGNIAPEVMAMVGDSFYHLQQYPEAIRVFSQIAALELSPGWRGKYLLHFAGACISHGEEESARKLLEGAGRENLPPADQQKTGLLLAELYQKRGELKKASDLYDRLLLEKRFLSDRDMASIYFGVGSLSNRQNRHEKAREALTRAIGLAGKDRASRELLRSAYAELGNSYHFEANHREAIRHYGQSLDMGWEPEMKGYWDVKYRLALSCLGAGENALADRLMDEILEEGDPALQQKMQIKRGFMVLERELKRLSLPQKGSKGGV